MADYMIHQGSEPGVRKRIDALVLLELERHLLLKKHEGLELVAQVTCTTDSSTTPTSYDHKYCTATLHSRLSLVVDDSFADFVAFTCRWSVLQTLPDTRK